MKTTWSDVIWFILGRKRNNNCNFFDSSSTGAKGQGSHCKNWHSCTSERKTEFSVVKTKKFYTKMYFFHVYCLSFWSKCLLMTISKLPKLNRMCIKWYWSTHLTWMLNRSLRFWMVDNIKVYEGGHISMEMKIFTYSNLHG